MILDRTDFSHSDFNDMPSIRAIHKRSFGTEIEPNLVQALIEAEDTTIDLYASIDGLLVGHGILTELKGPEKALALAPLAVDPEWRDFQIGTEIVRRLISAARNAGWRSIFVLGDPDYYGRFGFSSNLANCVDCEFQGNKFMALELVDDALARYKGALVYPHPFAQTKAA